MQIQMQYKSKKYNAMQYSTVQYIHPYARTRAHTCTRTSFTHLSRRAGKLPQGFNRFDHEASELRQEALLAEQRCALQSGEAGALAAAAATYERQSARLQESGWEL